MKRDDLRALELTDEQIDKVLAMRNKETAELDAKLASVDEITTERDELKSQLATRDKDMKKLADAATGNEALTAELDALKAQYKEDKAKYEANIEAVRLDSAINAELGNTNARDTSDLKKFIDMEQVKLGEDGKLTGLSGQIATLQTEKSYLFAGEVKSAGYEPTGGAASGPANLETAMKNDEFNMTTFLKQQGE